MKEAQTIGKIQMEVDPNQISRIVETGRLEEFVTQATKIFARDLKVQLVEKSVSMVSTSIVSFEGDRYGTVPPRPPIWNLYEELDQLKERVVGLDRGVR